MRRAEAELRARRAAAFNPCGPAGPAQPARPREGGGGGTSRGRSCRAELTTLTGRPAGLGSLASTNAHSFPALALPGSAHFPLSRRLARGPEHRLEGLGPPCCQSPVRSTIKPKLPDRSQER